MSEVRFFQNTQDQTQIPLACQSGCPRLLIGRGFFASPPWVLRFGRWTVTAAERDGVPIDDVVVRNVVCAIARGTGGLLRSLIGVVERHEGEIVAMIVAGLSPASV